MTDVESAPAYRQQPTRPDAGSVGGSTTMRNPQVPVARAADILEATMRDIDANKGEVSPSSWGSLLAVLGILRGDHDLPVCPDCGYACLRHDSLRCEQQHDEYRVRCADGVERHSSYWTDADEKAQFEFTFSTCGPHDCARRCVTYSAWRLVDYGREAE